jgi:hypothetical protein
MLYVKKHEKKSMYPKTPLKQSSTEDYADVSLIHMLASIKRKNPDDKAL